MTRMPRNRIVRALPFLVLSIFVLSGCGPDAKDMKIEDLTAENAQLKNELAERERQLNDALVREGEAQATIDDLNQRLAQLRSETDKTKMVDGWISTPSFDMISIPGSVLFDSGKAKLRGPGRTTVQKLASDIRSRYLDRDIYVIGHTDNEPIRKSGWADNWELGAERSLTIIREMTKLGIPQEQMIAASCGEYRPREPNATAQGRQLNRRVEFYAVRRDLPISDRTTANRMFEE